MEDARSYWSFIFMCNENNIVINIVLVMSQSRIHAL
jgi:hypothetical protein